MGRSIIIATRTDSQYQRISAIAQKHGYHVRRAADGEEAALLAREHLPNAIFLDLDVSPVNGVQGAREITDEFGIESFVVICHEPGKQQAARIGMGSDAADLVTDYPVKQREVVDYLNDAPQEPGFNGEHRVTFIDDRSNREHSTPHGAARLVETADNTKVVVMGEHVPNWAENRGVHVVVGDHGELVVAFRAVRIGSKQRHSHGLGRQCWFSNTPF